MQSLFQAMQNHVQERRGTPAEDAPDHDGGGNPERLVSLLYKKDKAPADERGGTSIIHASSTIKEPECARCFYLQREAAKSGYKRTAPPVGSMRLVWAYGRAAEAHVRDQLLSDPKMKADAYGKWECKCGNMKHTGRWDGTMKCDDCNGLLTVYKETFLLDKDNAISGSPDFIFWDVDAYRIVEIKSIKPDTTKQHIGFDTIDKPFPDHVNQGCHYVRMFRNQGFKVHRRPLVLYVNKAFSPKQWYRGLIPTDSQMDVAEESVASQVAVTGEYRVARDNGECPPKIDLCVREPQKYVKRCSEWTECMARKS